MNDLTSYQRLTYLDIILRGEEALARWSIHNPMRAVVIRNVNDARRQLGMAEAA